MTQTIFLTIIILVVGLVLREQLYQIKKILEKKEMEDICNYLNKEKIYIRNKDCKVINFYAHMVTCVDSKENCIIIDIE